MPHFRTAADARAYGEARERAGQYEAAAAAYQQEAAIRQRTGDPQAAEIERRRAERIRTDVALAVTAPVPAAGQKLAKLEPAAGCYLGALDDYADGDDADRFGRRIGKPLALCYDYSPYGAPFPMEWAERQAQAGRAIQIAWEPHDISAVRDDDYLSQWAKDAAGCGCPVFLRFGGEMNGNWTPWGRDPAAYRRAFRLVHAVINRYASNVALVWAPGAVPTYNLDTYYPGDDVVDWVGISLYLVRFNDDTLSRPASLDGPASFIAPFYAKYAARKPLCLTECAVSRRSRVEGRDADEFASARIFDLLDAIKIRYPRLKMCSAGSPGTIWRRRGRAVSLTIIPCPTAPRRWKRFAPPSAIPTFCPISVTCRHSGIRSLGTGCRRAMSAVSAPPFRRTALIRRWKSPPKARCAAPGTRSASLFPRHWGRSRCRSGTQTGRSRKV